MDLAVWWRERRWVALLDLIEDLYRKPHSRLSAALVNDPEAAEEIARQQGGKWSPSVAEWDLHSMLLAEILDRLGDVMRAVYATIPVEKGKSRPRIRLDPFPRPRTAIDVAREAASAQARQEILRIFAPHALN